MERFFSSEDNYRHAVVGPGGGNVWEIYFNPKRAKVGWVWVKPIAAIAQIVSGMRALVWTQLATDHSKHARHTLRHSRNQRSDRSQICADGHGTLNHLGDKL
jgi:hypothetical protein